MSSGPVQDSPVQTKLAVGNGKNIMFYMSPLAKTSQLLVTYSAFVHSLKDSLHCITI